MVGFNGGKGPERAPAPTDNMFRVSIFVLQKSHPFLNEFCVIQRVLFCSMLPRVTLLTQKKCIVRASQESTSNLLPLLSLPWNNNIFMEGVFHCHVS